MGLSDRLSIPVSMICLTSKSHCRAYSVTVMVGDHALRLGKHVGSLVNMVVVLRPEPRCENNNHGIIRQQTPHEPTSPRDTSSLYLSALALDV